MGSITIKKKPPVTTTSGFNHINQTTPTLGNYQATRIRPDALRELDNASLIHL